MRRNFFLATAVVAVLAAAPGWAGEVPNAVPDEVQATEQAPSLCPEATASPEAELDLDALLLPRPRPAWCPTNRPCPGGFCPDYPECGVPACVSGICQYW